MYRGRDAGAGPEAARQRARSRIDGDAGPALAGSLMRLKNWRLSRVARTHCGWIDRCVSSTDFYCAPVAETRCLPARLRSRLTPQTLKAVNDWSIQGAAGRARIGGRREAAGRHYGGADSIFIDADRRTRCYGMQVVRVVTRLWSAVWPKLLDLRRIKGFCDRITLGAAADVRDPAHDNEAASRAADRRIPGAHRHCARSSVGRKRTRGAREARTSAARTCSPTWPI